YHYEPLNAAELSEITDAWLDKYHFYRPHEAPGFLTPRHQDGAASSMAAQFSATVGVSIPHLAGVSYS
ncbi:MAG: transposase, partial [Spirochaetaceae bacterium]|nr:transposase [Spirochaetaceae bacterium]